MNNAHGFKSAPVSCCKYSEKLVFPIDYTGVYSRSCINIVKSIKLIAVSSADDRVGVVVR